MIEQAHDTGSAAGERETLEERAKKADEIIERKLKAVQNPNCIILAPHVRDLHLLAQMLYTFDRSVNQMRMKAGIEVPLGKLDEHNKRIGAFTEKVDGFIKSIGGNNYYGLGLISDNTEQRQILARNKRTHTFVPKTQESEKIAKLFKSLDSAYCEFKVKFPLADITKLGEVLSTMRQIVGDFDSLTADLSELTRTRYIPPKGLKAYLSKDEVDGVPDSGTKRTRGKKT